MIDINSLRRLAQAATKGPWVSQGRYIGTPRHMSYIGEVRDQCGNWSDTEKSRSDAAYIAAANPTTINELLDRLEEAEKEANKINGRMVEVKKRLQLIVEEPSNTMSNAKAMREMLRQANLALNALK